MTKIYVVAAIALVMASCGQKKQECCADKTAQALPEYKERWDSTTVKGTVIDINAETREITVMGAQGNLLTFTASEQVERFNEIAVNDVITFGALTYVKAEFREPTPEEIAEPLVIVTEAAIAPENMAPAGSVGTMVKGVVTIEALNRPFMLATVKGPKGNFLTLPVEDSALMTNLRIGQVLVLTYAEVNVVALTKVQ